MSARRHRKQATRYLEDMPYIFREPIDDADWDALRRLNHRVFAEEIGQHDIQPDGRLRDSQEGRGRYVLAVKDGTIIGMAYANGEPPFSVEHKLADAAILGRLPGPLVEVRLLAIDAAHRGGMVLRGLLGALLEEALEMRAGTIIISGIAARVEMYRRIGFAPLGPAVQRGRGVFVPMALQLDELSPHIQASLRRLAMRSGKS